MPWGAAIAAAGTVASTHMQADAQGKAAQQAAKGDKKATKAQQEAALAQQAALAPWRQSGSQALNKLNQYYGLGGMTGGGQQEPMHTYKDEQIQKWIEDNPDDPRLQEVISKFSPQGGRGTTGGVRGGQPPAMPNMGQGFAPGAFPQAYGLQQPSAQAQQIQANMWKNPQEQALESYEAMAAQNAYGLNKYRGIM